MAACGGDDLPESLKRLEKWKKATSKEADVAKIACLLTTFYGPGYN